MKLAQKRCIPCEGGIPPFGKKQIAKYLPQLAKGWSVIDDKKLRKRFQFKNFVDTMGFVNKIALIATQICRSLTVKLRWNFGRMPTMDSLRMILFWPRKLTN